MWNMVGYVPSTIYWNGMVEWNGKSSGGHPFITPPPINTNFNNDHYHLDLVSKLYRALLASCALQA